MSRIKVYLAGPEVFLPNAKEILDQKSQLAFDAGFEPLAPLDKEIPPAPTRHAFGVAIYQGNLGLMNKANAIIANLTPFRGIAADTGTSFELGYMTARDATAFGYSNVTLPHFERISAHYTANGGQITHDGLHFRGPDGLSLENFDMIDNLMLDGAIIGNRGGFITHNAAEDALYTDFTAYKQCLEALSKLA